MSQVCMTNDPNIYKGFWEVVVVSLRNARPGTLFKLLEYIFY